MSKRLQFFLSHLCVSFCLALFIVAWVLLIWYPSPLAKAVGVTHIFLMLIAIDVILGPLLGFVIYKEKKKTLKFDLSVIIIIQLLALAYGVFNIAQARPVWIVFNEHQFEVIQNNYLIKDNLNQAQPEFKQVTWLKPQFAAVGLAEAIDERKWNQFDEIFAGISLAQRPERYIPISQAESSIQKQAQNLDVLLQYNDEVELKHILDQYPSASKWIPLKATVENMVVLLNENAEIIKIVDLRPWK